MTGGGEGPVLAGRRGGGQRVAWLQCGDFESGDLDVRLTIQRQRDSRHVEVQVRLHDDDGDEARGREPPRCARFSFDHGRDADLHLSGVGFVLPDDDGRVSFTTGQGGYDQSLGLMRR